MGVSGEAMGVREGSAKYDLQVARPGVPVGYKETEVGVIPEDWGLCGLLSAVCIANGQVDPKHEPYRSMILVAPNHIESGSGKLLSKQTAAEQRAVSGKYVFEPGDIVYSKIRPYLKKAILANFQGLCSADMYPLKPASNISGGFILAVLLAHRFTKYAESVSVRSGMPKINREELADFVVALPQVIEQRAIATALSDMDALLDGLDRLIAKKRDLKQAAMQQLLTGQTRLPGFEGEWEVKTLEQLADIRSGGTPSTSSSHYWNGDIPWCTPTDITALKEKKYLIKTERTISLAGLRASSAETIPANSIIMTSRATIGECAINLLPMTTNQGFKNLIPRDEVDFEFLYYLMTMQKERLIQLCGGSTFLEIGKRQLTGFEVIIPCARDEQTAIATVLSDMDAEIESLEQRRHKTRDLKQAMMQELLTGRTRLIKPLVQDLQKEKEQPGEKKANVYFMRSVLAAEIIDQLHEEPTFGHVKFEKVLFLVEHLCEVDTGSTYHRQAAGPYDNKALRSIDSQLRKQQWFDAHKESGRYHYVPLNKQGGHKTYFDRYFSDISTNLMEIIETFRTFDTERCEIVATLFSAWSDLLGEKSTVSDDMIVHEVLNNWHESKKRISEDRWRNALGWMREKGFVPKRFASA